MNGGISLLPGWARSELGVLRPGLVRNAVDRPAVLALSGVLTWACGPSEIAAAARERIAGHVVPGQASAADERESIKPLM